MENIRQGYGLDILAEGEGVPAGVDDKAFGGPQVFTGPVKAPSDRRSAGAFYLDGEQTGIAAIDNQIDLGTAAGPIITVG